MRIVLPGLVALALLSGCGGGSGSVTTPAPPRVELTPACSDPAPIEGKWDPAIHGFFVVFAEGTTEAQVREQTPLLAAKYGFTPTFVFPDLRTFAVDLTPEQAAALRCESGIGSLSYRGGGTLGGAAVSGKG